MNKRCCNFTGMNPLRTKRLARPTIVNGLIKKSIQFRVKLPG